MSKMTRDETKKNKTLPEYWSDFLLEEFYKETDRAAIILTTSLFENALGTLIKIYLAPTGAKNDVLCDGPTAPLSEFSSKIQLAQRLGLISQKFANDLNIIRKIRNEFAHNVHGSNLDSGKIKELLTTLIYSSDILKNSLEGRNIFPSGVRGDFLVIAHIMLWYLHQEIERMGSKQIKPAGLEWIYSWVYKKPAGKPPTETGQSDSKTDPTK